VQVTLTPMAMTLARLGWFPEPGDEMHEQRPASVHESGRCAAETRASLTTCRCAVVFASP
jgi:hypothetical protein